MRIFAHRGANCLAPENTLLAFKLAIENGAKWIELDVHFYQGRLVVCHDAPKTLENLPTLDEVFELVDKKAGINIELKSEGTVEPTLACIHRFLKKGWQYDQLLVSSFNHALLKEMSQKDPKILIGVLWDSEVQFNWGFPAYSLNVSKELVTKSLIDRAHQQNLKFYVFTINGLHQIKRLLALGVDGVFTDDVANYLDYGSSKA